VAGGAPTRGASDRSGEGAAEHALAGPPGRGGERPSPRADGGRSLAEGRQGARSAAAAAARAGRASWTAAGAGEGERGGGRAWGGLPGERAQAAGAAPLALPSARPREPCAHAGLLRQRRRDEVSANACRYLRSPHLRLCLCVRSSEELRGRECAGLARSRPRHAAAGSGSARSRRTSGGLPRLPPALPRRAASPLLPRRLAGC